MIYHTMLSQMTFSDLQWLCYVRIFNFISVNASLPVSQIQHASYLNFELKDYYAPFAAMQAFN